LQSEKSAQPKNPDHRKAMMSKACSRSITKTESSYSPFRINMEPSMLRKANPIAEPKTKPKPLFDACRLGVNRMYLSFTD